MTDFHTENMFRRFYSLPPREEGDTRPEIVFGDIETRKRTDLTPRERTAVKHSTFLKAYGAPANFPDLHEMRALSREDAAAMVERFWNTYGGAVVEPLRDAMEKEGPAFVMDTLAEQFPDPGVPAPDYRPVEQRVLAHMMCAQGKLADTAKMVAQVGQAAEQMHKTTARLMKVLEGLEQRYGVTSQVLGEHVSVAIPQSMPDEEKEAVMQEIREAMDDETAQDAPQWAEQSRRVVEIGHRGGKRASGLLAALAMLASGSGSLSGLGPVMAPLPPPPSPHANRKSGEIGRVSPDLAWKLRAKGHPEVQPGDMLFWHVEGDTGEMCAGIFTLDASGMMSDHEIPLAHLPHKVQKRALQAKPVLQ